MCGKEIISIFAEDSKQKVYCHDCWWSDKWDPFEEPKDPIDIRRDKTKRTTQMLVREFLQSCSAEEYSNAYGRGVLEMALGIVNEDDYFQGMYEFSCWYRDLLKKEGQNDI